MRRGCSVQAHNVRAPDPAPAPCAGAGVGVLPALSPSPKSSPSACSSSRAGQTTLATRIFDAHDDAHLGDLGAASLWLLLMVLGAQVVLWRWSHHEH